MAEAPKELLASIEKGAALKHVDAPEENPALAQAKIEAAIKKGSFDLKHVEAPAGGVSDAVKAAYIEDKKNPQPSE